MKMEERKNEIVKAMTEVEFYPATSVDDFNEKPSLKLPIDKLTTLGVAVNPLTAAIQTAINGPNGMSGIYYVNTKGSEMFQANDGTGFIGGLKNSIGGVGGGQARMNAIPCDPTMLFVAAALMQIEKKLDTIQETQMKILEFLEEDKKSKLTANLNYLSEEIGKYKLNYNDPVYINSTLTTVKIIRRDASADIEFYRAKIMSPLKNKKFFTNDADIKKRLRDIQLNFKYYQMALYVYAFASFFETMLQKNFNSDNLEYISQSIRTKAIEYRELYTTCYTKLENLSDSSIESYLCNGMADINNKAGNTIRNVPVLEKGLVDEGLIALGNKLRDINTDKTNKILNAFIGCKENYVNIFIESVNNVNELYNTPMDICFDADNIYYFHPPKESFTA